ncbi:MAG: trehalose-6-phosphate synthase, partial [Gluconacetobacter diazotrophicus]|nr:trehalose-6-phosphate synthase [Gluconacetobacter diazotrophicus]
PDDPGILVLSKFAGAARQLGAAILVNPVDPDEIADAIDLGLRMSRPERQDRWKACWEAIKDASALEWGRSFVAALSRAGGDVQRGARPGSRGMGDGPAVPERRPGAGAPDIRIVSNQSAPRIVNE